MKALSPAERLIVAADFKPNPNATTREGRTWVFQKVVELAQSLKGTGVYLKMNSALRAHGYDLIDMVHDLGLRVFADLKLCDIPETLSTDGALLREARPDLLTVMCLAGHDAMVALKDELPDTEVLGVTVLTSIKEAEANRTFAHATLIDSVCMLAENAAIAGLGGIICSAKEAGVVRQQVIIRPYMTINTPGIRPLWTFVEDDDQNQLRVMTPYDAIRAGVTRIILGRPIVKAVNPYDAVMRTIDEIDRAVVQP